MLTLTLTLPLLTTTGQLYGLEKFWAFLKYSKAKNMDIDPKLQEYLSKFKRLEDFRVDVSTRPLNHVIKKFHLLSQQMLDVPVSCDVPFSGL